MFLCTEMSKVQYLIKQLKFYCYLFTKQFIKTKFPRVQASPLFIILSVNRNVSNNSIARGILLILFHY